MEIKAKLVALANSSLSPYREVVAELKSFDQDPESETKKHRITRFLNVPFSFEKLMYIGTLICLNSLIEIFTVLPAKTALGVCRMLSSIVNIGNFRMNVLDKLHIAQFLIFSMCVYLVNMVSISDVYHSIRSQSLVKFYVIYNMLDVCGRLCYTFGTDSLSAFYATILESNSKFKISGKEALFFTVCLVYVLVHTLVLYFQAVTLNVSFNSSNNGLFTLILSCQFAEIKGNVFKKIDKNGLYKVACSDIAERFQLGTFVAIIMIRDLLEIVAHKQNNDNYIKNTKSPTLSPLPGSWWLSEMLSSPFLYFVCAILKASIAPLMTLISEFFIDWIKHAFILRLNNIDIDIYEVYVSNICRELYSNGNSKMPIDTPQSEDASQLKPEEFESNSTKINELNLRNEDNICTETSDLHSPSSDSFPNTNNATNSKSSTIASELPDYDYSDKHSSSRYNLLDETELVYTNISAKGARIIEFIPLPLACLLASVSIDTLRLARDLFFTPPHDQDNVSVTSVNPVTAVNNLDLSTSSLLNLKNVKLESNPFPDPETCPPKPLTSEQGSDVALGAFNYSSLNVIAVTICTFFFFFYLKLFLNRKITNKARNCFDSKKISKKSK